jgi:hypothetical protein
LIVVFIHGWMQHCHFVVPRGMAWTDGSGSG